MDYEIKEYAFTPNAAFPRFSAETYPHLANFTGVSVKDGKIAVPTIYHIPVELDIAMKECNGTPFSVLFLLVLMYIRQVRITVPILTDQANISKTGVYYSIKQLAKDGWIVPEKIPIETITRQKEAKFEDKITLYLKDNSINHERQYQTQYGRLDILITDVEFGQTIIEVKKDSSRSCIYQAIGQLLTYKLDFPIAKLYIATPKPISASMVKIMKLHGIEAWPAVNVSYIAAG